MKIIVLFFLISTVFASEDASQHRKEMKMLRSSLYSSADDYSENIPEENSDSYVETDESERSFLKRREALLKNKHSDKKVEIFDLENLYFKDSVSSKMAAPKPDKQ